MSRLRELYDFREFFVRFVAQQLHGRYHGSLLGFAWTLLNPLLIFLSLTLVFSHLNHWILRDHGIYFFSSFIAWNFFAGSCLTAAESIVGNPAFVTRIYAPKPLFPLSAVAMTMVDQLTSLFVLAFFMWLWEAPFTMSLLFLPVSIVLFAAFVTGASLLCACWNVRFRDFRHLLNALLFLWFFLSPIFWKISALPLDVQSTFEMNPLLPFLRLFQMPIWMGVMPPPDAIAWSCAISAGILLLGAVVFTRMESTFYYYL